MPLDEINFFPNVEYQPLITTFDVKFTEREIDVMSCIVNGHTSRKSIGSFLSIEPTTAGVHIGNIRGKLQFSSWENIRDFIEKSDQKILFNHHFAQLARKNNFSKVLLNIKKIIPPKTSGTLLIDTQNYIEIFTTVFFKVGIQINSAISNNYKKNTVQVSIPENTKVIVFNVPDYQYFEELILDILRKSFQDKQIEKLTSDFYVRPNTNIEVISAKKVSNIVSSRLSIISKRYLFILFGLSLLFIGIFIHLYKLYFPHPSVLHQEVKLPDDSLLLKREGVIDNINEKYKNQKGISTVALTGIVGIGGVGKTTLARMWKKDFEKQHPNVVIWEVNAENLDSLFQSFKLLALTLAKAPSQKEELRYIDILKNSEQTVQLIKFVQKNLNSLKKWVLIFDNVESLVTIREFIPQDPLIWGNGKVLITTRNNHIKNADIVNENNIINITELSEDETLKLFIRIMDKKPYLSQVEKKNTLHLLKHIPPFPLDISVAAKYIKNKQISYEDYIKELKITPLSNMQKKEELLIKNNEYSQTRYKIIKLSLNQILEQEESFKNLLLMVSIAESQNIPIELLEKLYSKEEVNNFIYEMEKQSLITEIKHYSDVRVISFHRSTHEIIKGYCSFGYKNTKKYTALGEIFAALEQYANGYIDHSDFGKLKFISPHYKNINFFKSLGDEVYYKMLIMSVFYDCFVNSAVIQESKLLDALKYFRSRNMTSYTRRTLMYLGIVNKKIGKLEQSKLYLEESLLFYCQKLDWDKYSHTLKILYLVYNELGEHKKAHDLTLKRVDILKNHLEHNDVDFLESIAGLGVSYLRIGEYKKAKELIEPYDFNLDMLKKKATFPLAQDMISMIYLELGNYEEAKKYNIYAHNILLKHQVNMIGNSGLNFGLKGRIYKELGDYEIAMEWINKAVAFHSKNYPKSLFLSGSRMQQGVLYTKLGLFNDATTIFHNVLKKYEEIFNGEHFSMYRVWLDMGILLINKQEYKNAQIILEKSLSYKTNINIQKQIHFNTVTYMLGYVYHKLGDHKNGRIFIEEGLKNYKNHYGVNHLRNAEPIRYLGEVYLARDDFVKADQLFNQSLKILENYDNHPDRHWVYECLAQLHQKMAKNSDKEMSAKNMTQAKLYLEKALEIAEDNLPKESEHILRIKKSLQELKI